MKITDTEFIEYSSPAYIDRLRVFVSRNPQEVALRIRDATQTDNFERYTARMSTKQARSLAAMLLRAADSAEEV